jgi:oligopeptide transport system ATP-binding protein
VIIFARGAYMQSRDNILEVKNLIVSFKTYSGTVQAVRNISFNLKRGETLSIVGESGSGKSVTTKAIMGILSNNALIESGSIIYKNTDLTEISEQEYCRIRGKRIAMVFQDPFSALNPVMRVGNQIVEAFCNHQAISKKRAKSLAIEYMNHVGISQPEKRFYQYPFQLSGGMRQRIVILIALACNPEILICDEPTTALDVTIQAKILDLIKDLKKERDLSIIFITHNMGVVANIADRICVMYAGKIVEYGTSEDIFYNPAHPYTWALLSAIPDDESKERMFSIPGAPPNMLQPPRGDAFAPRNIFAMDIDFIKEPPLFKISDTHYAATWLLHPWAPKVQLPSVLENRINRMKKDGKKENDAG